MITSSQKKIILLGGGGYAKCVAELAHDLGFQIVGFLDDEPTNWGKTVLGFSVLGGITTENILAAQPDGMVVAIGNNRIRQMIADRVASLATTIPWLTLCHPRASIAHSASIGVGTVLLAGAIVNTEAQIASHVIIGSGAIVEHECVIENFAHISSGARLGGGVSIGIRSTIDTGGIVNRLVRIADDSWVSVGEVIAK